MVTASDLGLAVLERVDSIEREMRYQSMRVNALAARAGVVDKFTVAETAEILQVSLNTVRARFADVLETVPGGKKRWVPERYVREAFISAAVVRGARKRQKKAA